MEDEVLTIRTEGIDTLISLLTPQEQDDLGLKLEASACEKAGIEYLNFAIPDRGVPASQQAFGVFVKRLQSALENGKRIGAHCRAGIGRSSLVIAALLCSQGLSSEEAFARLSTARGLSVPDTQEQARWVAEFGRSLDLNRASTDKPI